MVTVLELELYRLTNLTSSSPHSHRPVKLRSVTLQRRCVARPRRTCTRPFFLGRRHGKEKGRMSSPHPARYERRVRGARVPRHDISGNFGRPFFTESADFTHPALQSTPADSGSSPRFQPRPSQAPPEVGEPVSINVELANVLDATVDPDHLLLTEQTGPLKKGKGTVPSIFLAGIPCLVARSQMPPLIHDAPTRCGCPSSESALSVRRNGLLAWHRGPAILTGVSPSSSRW